MLLYVISYMSVSSPREPIEQPPDQLQKMFSIRKWLLGFYGWSGRIYKGLEKDLL